MQPAAPYSAACIALGLSPVGLYLLLTAGHAVSTCRLCVEGHLDRCAARLGLERSRA